MQHTYVIRTPADVCAHRTVTATSVVSALLTPGVTCSRGDAGTVSAILQALLGRHATAVPDSVTARKATRDGSATSVPSDTMVIRTVADVTVMSGDRFLILTVVWTVMNTVSVFVKR